MKSRVPPTSTGRWALLMALAASWQIIPAKAVGELDLDLLAGLGETSLNEAADNADITFTAPTRWTGQLTADAADGQDAIVSPLLANLGVDLDQGLQGGFTSTQTTRVEFDIRYNSPLQFQYPNPQPFLLVDGVNHGLQVNGDGWTHHSALVGPGTHHIAWWFPYGPSPSNDVRRLMLDRITLTPVAGISPNEAVDLPDGALAGIVPFNAEATGVSGESRDGVDSLRLTIPAGGSVTIGAPAVKWDEIHLWAKTDAPQGKVRLGTAMFTYTYAIASSQWVPLLMPRASFIVYNDHDAPVHVWLDSLTEVPVPEFWNSSPSSRQQLYDSLALNLDWPGLANGVWGFSGNFAFYADPAISHDGADVAVMTEYPDDDGQFYLELPVSGPARISFWWRMQPLSAPPGDSAWITFGGESDNRDRLFTFDTSVARDWQHASVNIPAGSDSVRIVMKDAYHSLLFMDQFETVAVDPLETYAGLIASKGLTGPAAAPDFDADGDGWKNLIEYALGTDPVREASHPASPVDLVFDPAAPSFLLSLPGFQPAAHFDTSMTFQSAADPAGPWQDVLSPDPYDYLPQPDGTITISTAVGLTDRGFYRAKFSTRP